jgi:hypothetical protein
VVCDVPRVLADRIDLSLEGFVTVIHSLFPSACVTVGLGCLLALPRTARAQTFVELGGGVTYLAPAPPGNGYSRGFNIQASIGRQFTRRFLLRCDAFMSQFDYRAQIYPPFLTPEGPEYHYGVRSEGVAGLTANGVVNVDPRGILYVVGGAGLYDTYGGTGSVRFGTSAAAGGLARVSFGVSAGAGISVPAGGRLRAFVEARDHLLLGANSQPPWLVPITLGLRY